MFSNVITQKFGRINNGHLKKKTNNLLFKENSISKQTKHFNFQSLTKSKQKTNCLSTQCCQEIKHLLIRSLIQYITRSFKLVALFDLIVSCWLVLDCTSYLDFSLI